jgi:hypothetical protein
VILASIFIPVGFQRLGFQKKGEARGSLTAFGKRLLRKVLGLVQDGEMWRIRQNRKLYELFKEPDFTIGMKIMTLISQK